MISKLKDNYVYIIIYFLSGGLFFYLMKSILTHIDLFYDYTLYLLLFLYLLLGIFYIINKKVCIIIYFLMLIIILFFRRESQGINFQLYFKKWMPLLFKNKTIFINIIGNVIIYIPLGIILYKKIYYGSLIIVILECLQYLLSRGIFDIMDIILSKRNKEDFLEYIFLILNKINIEMEK